MRAPSSSGVCPGASGAALTHVIMDKGYESTHIRAQLVAQDIVPVIPPKSNRIAPLDYEKDLYK